MKGGALKPVEIDAELRRGADELLDRGVRSALAAYGSVHVVGSYALGLMGWRDLDVEVVRTEPDREAFFRLGGELATLLRPLRMSYRDEIIGRSPGLPEGLYRGVHMGAELGGAWKIDIWAVGAAHERSKREERENILARLTAASRDTILRIKADMWTHRDYRRTFSATDIYNAVLDEGVTDVDAFRAFMARQGRAI